MTTAAGAVIDLDLAGAAPSRPGVARRSWSRRPGRRPTPAAVAAVAFALLVVLGADAIGDRPRFAAPVDLSLGGVDSWSMGDQSVYALAEGELTAYRLEDGARRWTVRVPPDAIFTEWDLAGLIMLIMPASARSVAYAEASGARVWERSGLPNWGSSDGRTIVMGGDDDVDGVDAVSWQTFTRIDVRTGRPNWAYARRFGADSPVLAPDGVGGSDLYGMLRVDDTGSWLTDLATGVERPLPGRWRWAQVVHGVLLAAAGRGALTAYDLATMRPLWTNGEWTGSVLPCGPNLCLDGESGVVAVDPATGRVRWRAALHVQGGNTDRIFASDLPDGSADSFAVVIDAGTGEVLRRFPDRLVMSAGSRGRAPMVGFDPRTRLLDVAVLDLDRLIVYPLDRVPGAVDTCRATMTHLACPTAPGRLRIWRYAA